VAAVNNAMTPEALQFEIVKENKRNFTYENGVDWFALRRLPLAGMQRLNPYIKDATRLILPIPISELAENNVIHTRYLIDYQYNSNPGRKTNPCKK
jgi:hypothetical protein